MAKITLEPRNIREFWDEILPGILAIKERWPDMCTWRPEDVYAEVVNGNAVLYRTEDGFAICTTQTDPWNGETDFVIWIAYAYKRGGMLQKYWPAFIEVAESLGCKGIQTDSLHPILDSSNAVNLDIDKWYSTYRCKLNG